MLLAGARRVLGSCAAATLQPRPIAPVAAARRLLSSQARQQQRVPILIYHHVYPEGSDELGAATFETGSGVIGEAAFRTHLEFLRDEGWSVVGTSAVVEWLQGGGELPERAAVLHFDNGWLDSYTVVAPILEEFGFCATLFPITDVCSSPALPSPTPRQSATPPLPPAARG